MENTYWNNTGDYQAEYNRLVQLMPGSGAADTLGGELIRCVSRLGHELYNNGMGNNSSGAVNMLLEFGAITPITHATIYPFTRGALYEGRYEGDAFQVAVESAVDQVIEYIINNRADLTANTADMFDWAEPEQHWCEDCGDEVDYMVSVCSDCEEAYEDEEEEESRLRIQEEDEYA
tara:strand:- start:33 stop:560 length:528 start_codon:yes stop_codon:yes gene_type:complete